jgi:hypothetical protein
MNLSKSNDVNTETLLRCATSDLFLGTSLISTSGTGLFFGNYFDLLTANRFSWQAVEFWQEIQIETGSHSPTKQSNLSATTSLSLSLSLSALFVV